MASEDPEESIEYDEEFEEEHEAAPHASPAVSALASSALPAAVHSKHRGATPASAAIPAATVVLTDAELDEYLDDEDPELARELKNRTAAAAAAAALAGQQAAAPATTGHGAGPQLSTSLSAVAAQPSTDQYPRLQESGPASAQASYTSNHALQQGSRQLSNSRQNSRGASGVGYNSAHATAAASLNCNTTAVGARDVCLSHNGSQIMDSCEIDHQQDSTHELDTMEGDMHVASSTMYTAASGSSSAAIQQFPSSKSSDYGGLTATAQELHPSTQKDATWPAAAAAAAQFVGDAAGHSYWLSAPQGVQLHLQPSTHSSLEVQHPFDGLQLSTSQRPVTPAAAAAVFSSNAAVAAASAAAAIAAADAAIAQVAGASVHVVPHTNGNKPQSQRPASASAAVGQNKQRSKPRQQQAAASRSWCAQQQQQQPENFYQQQQLCIEVLPVTQWTVHDVCDWVEGIGLSQYRKKFMHNCTDGRLLLRLTDEVLKKELGIGPLGHRALILDALEALQSADLSAAAAAAAAGTPAEEVAQDGTSPAVATALLVAGCVAARAAERQSSGRHGSRGSAACMPPNNTGRCGGLDSAASGDYCEGVAWTANRCGSREGSITGGSPAAASRGRPGSAPCKGRRRHPQSPQAVSPGALGPAAGRISVHEQRAKLLFELGRAQARAATQSSTAAHVSDAARIAADEVARLQGQLAELDRKNRMQVQHSAGSLDSRGHIPWQHVGPGTHAADPHPECFARPWDPPEADLTFKPKISKSSQRIMAEAQGGFLDRLNNDLKRRQVKQKKLERRYNPFGGAAGVANAAAAAKAYAADLQLVSGYLSQRGWAELNKPISGNGYMDIGVQQEIDEPLDEVVESHAKGLSLGEPQRASILAARGAKKVAAVAAAVRTQQFMDRYKADLTARDGRLQELQEKWFKQQLQGVPVATGPTGRVPAVPLAPEQRDMRQALLWFKQLGWGVEEPEDDCEALLDALVKRAQAYKTELEKLHDKAAVATAAGQQAQALLEPSMNWQSAPWSVDGLNPLMQNVLDAQKAAGDAAAAKPASTQNKPSASDTVLKAAGKSVNDGLARSVKGAAGGKADTATSGSVNAVFNPLHHAVKLLAGMRWDGLNLLEAAAGKAKKLAVYKALRTQQFLEFTANDLAVREAKQRATWEAIEASRRGKVVSKQELDAFYDRLQADGEKRKAELAKAQADKADREQRALALVSIGAGHSTRSSCRPKSAR